jgi:hypothetical protein
MGSIPRQINVMHLVERTGSGQLVLTWKAALMASNSCGLGPPLSLASTATHLDMPVRFRVDIVAEPWSGDELQSWEPHVQIQLLSSGFRTTWLPTAISGTNPIQSLSLAPLSMSKTITTLEPETTQAGVVILFPLTAGATIRAAIMAPIRFMLPDSRTKWQNYVNYGKLYEYKRISLVHVRVSSWMQQKPAVDPT